MSASATVRAAGLLVNKQADRFERNLTQRLQNVKGIDLDGDGQIDDNGNASYCLRQTECADPNVRIHRSSPLGTPNVDTPKTNTAAPWFGLINAPPPALHSGLIASYTCQLN